MAKKAFGIAEAIRSEVKTPTPTVSETKIEEPEAVAPVVEPAAPVVPETAPVAPVKVAKKRGRPRKDEERSEFVRTAVTPALKKKLHIICSQKDMTESDYTFELLKKAINRDFEQAFSAMREDVE